MPCCFHPIRAGRGVEEVFTVVVRVLAQPVNSIVEASADVIAKKSFVARKVFFIAFEKKQIASS